MKYRIFLTDANKRKCNITTYGLPNGWNTVTVTDEGPNARTPYKVTFSTGRHTYFRSNKCYWDEVDVSIGGINDLTNNIDLIPITLLKRKQLCNTK